MDHATGRAWPPPTEPWIMYQGWHDLLFAHWPVKAAVLRELLPPSLELDTFEGEAWLGIVPFRMAGVHLRAVPAIPGLSEFPELNVRTYVTVGDKPGAYFFSMDAANPLFVTALRLLAHLPYLAAAMSVSRVGAGFKYNSHRLPYSVSPTVLRAEYEPTGGVFHARRETLEYFLTERYCLYTTRGRRVYRCEIHHAPWPLQPAEADFQRNTMASSLGIPLPDTQPLLHFSRRQDTIVWPMRPVETQ